MTRHPEFVISRLFPVFGEFSQIAAFPCQEKQCEKIHTLSGPSHFDLNYEIKMPKKYQNQNETTNKQPMKTLKTGWKQVLMRDTGFPNMGYSVWVGLLNNYCGKTINKEQRKKVSQFLKYTRKKHTTSNGTHNNTPLQTDIKVLKLQLNQQMIDLQKAQKKIQRQKRSLSHIKQVIDSNITELVTIDWHNKLEEYLTQVKA